MQFASLIPTTLRATVVGIPLSSHSLSSAPLVTGVTYCTMSSAEGYGVWVCSSYSYSGLGLGCPCLSSSFAAPVLYWSGNLIKHVSLKMQYPTHQHMGLEHFVLAAPAVSLIRFAACSSVLHLHDCLTPPATGLCKKHFFFFSPKHPISHTSLPLFSLCSRGHISPLFNAFRHALNTPRCTAGDTTQTADLFYILPIKQTCKNKKAVCMFVWYLTLIPLFHFKYTHTNLCTKIDTYRHTQTPHLQWGHSVLNLHLGGSWDLIQFQPPPTSPISPPTPPLPFCNPLLFFFM